MSLLHFSFLMKAKDHFMIYPAFSTLNYFWCFGSTSFFCLMFQMISGFILTMFYSPNMDLAFYSIESFMSEFAYGWLMSYFHCNGASMFFMAVYTHMFSGLYYKSYSKVILWLTGMVMWVLLMGTSFLGYVLPWGQMSYWGCMVITSLVTAIPYAGKFILSWVWGGNTMSELTLMSMYSVHFLLPFMLLAVSLVHMIFVLHIEGSSSPSGIENFDYVNFWPYLIVKDLFAFVLITLSLYLWLVFFNPNKLGDSLNYIPANPMKTPVHMVPEWYFLPFYCMLSCIPNKVYGILCMGASMFIFAILPLFPGSLVPAKFDILHKYLFTFFVMTCLNLMWLATQHMTDFMIDLSSFWTVLYFLYFLLTFLNCIAESILFKSFSDNSI